MSSYFERIERLFPAFNDEEYCDVQQGKAIIQDVFNEHMRVIELTSFCEVEEELYSFNDIMRKYIDLAYESGREKTWADSQVSRDHAENWDFFANSRREEYLTYYETIQQKYLKEIGHYPLDAYTDTLYYNIDGGITAEKQTELSNRLGLSNYDRGFINVEYNERLFSERALELLHKETNTNLQSSSLATMIQELFADYINRVSVQNNSLDFIMDSGLCWIHFTRSNIDLVLRMNDYSEAIRESYTELLLEMRQNFILDVHYKKQPEKCRYSFNNLTEDDLRKIYIHMLNNIKRKPQSMFSEDVFISALYNGNYKNIYISGVKDKLKYITKVLKYYASDGWLESVAISIGKKPDEIDGSKGYNGDIFTDTFPIKYHE